MNGNVSHLRLITYERADLGLFTWTNRLDERTEPRLDTAESSEVGRGWQTPLSQDFFRCNLTNTDYPISSDASRGAQQQQRTDDVATLLERAHGARDQ